MTSNELIDLYTDYLIVSTGQVTATGLASVLDNVLHHDSITRLLNEKTYTSKELWMSVKPLVRQVEDATSGLLIIDDHIEEKRYSRENDQICWHYDHSEKRNIKGINQITLLLHSKNTNIPLGFEIIKKTELSIDPTTQKQKRTSPVTKNEYYRQLLKQACQNNVQFKYILNDSWYSGHENMRFIRQTLNKEFIMAIKSNTLIQLMEEDSEQKSFQGLGNLNFGANEVKQVIFKGVDFPVYVIKAVFKDENGKDHILYLATSDLTLTAEQIIEIYQKRWKIEEFHKSMKSNLGFAKSPTHTVRTQNNHFYFCMLAFVKLEQINSRLKSNHFALKEKIYRHGLKKAFAELKTLKKLAFYKAA